MNRTFVLYNSVWQNLVMTLLCSLFFIPSIAFGFIVNADVWSRCFVASMGFGTVLFGFRLFDRRSKIIVNESGLLDNRSRYGLLPWAEITGFKMWAVKGNLFITLSLRDPEKWISRSGALTRLFACIRGKNKFSVTVSLQNMTFDETALRSFFSDMVPSKTCNG